MFAVCEGAIVFVYIRNQVVDETGAEAWAGCGIPVSVIGKYHNERLGFVGMDKLVCNNGSTDTYPLILIVSLPVK